MTDPYDLAVTNQHIARMRADNRRRHVLAYLDCDAAGLVDVGAYAFQGVAKIGSDKAKDISGPAQVIKLRARRNGGRNAA